MASASFRRTTAVSATAACLALAGAMALAGASAFASSTKSDETPGPPRVVTGKARATSTGATLTGTITTKDLPTTYYFVYGPSASSLTAETTHVSIPAAKTPTKVSQYVAGLAQGEVYELLASNGPGAPVAGKPLTFTNTKKDVFVLPKSFEPVTVGGTLVIAGTLSGANAGHREIVLQASPYPYKAAFADVGAPILTSAYGAFSFRERLTTGTHFRIATVGSAPVYSDVIPAQVEVRVVLKARVSRYKKGLVRLYGTVSPAEVGARVFFQIEREAKQKAPKADKPEKLAKSEKAAEKAAERPPTFADKFTTVVKHATRSVSRFSLVVSIEQAGNYRAFVSLPPGPYASGYSGTVTLTATTAKKKHKKKK
jgi:hypothetical protein